MLRHSLMVAVALAAAALVAPPVARAQAPTSTSTSTTDFAALERQGVTIRAIRIDTGNIFDLSDPDENRRVFSWVNTLHITTRPSLIAATLLFREGERISRQKIEESERLLRDNRYLYEAKIRAENVADGKADLVVATRDAWTISFGASGSTAGGTTKTSVDLTEYNFLGTGVRLSVSRRNDSERKGTQYEAAYDKAFDGWTSLNALRSRYNDGTRNMLSMVRPFYSLDARWAGGLSYDDHNRVDSLYNAGDTVAEYRHRARVGNAFGGLSRGLVDGWTWRWIAGVQVNDDHYQLEAGKTAPPRLPLDSKLRAPYVEFNAVEDDFIKLTNRDQIGRTEYVAQGWNLGARLGYAASSLGSSQTAVVGSLAMRKGFVPGEGQNLFARATWDRRLSSVGGTLDQTGVAFRYFLPQNRQWLTYVSGSLEHLSGAGVADQFLLGGNNGLRGYPSRYQTGINRALFTVEQRYYADWYPFRLFRVGGAVFFDTGRAWKGENQNRITNGPLRDVGIGLRIAVDRAAFANVLHIDVASPLDRTSNIKRNQYLVKTELNF